MKKEKTITSPLYWNGADWVNQETPPEEPEPEGEAGEEEGEKEEEKEGEEEETS